MEKNSANKSSSSSDLDPRDVYDFLEQNPGFISRNWDLFADFVPSGEGQGNVFLKKQIETLSERQEEQNKTIQHILEVTRNLEEMQDMLAGFSNTLLDQGHPSSDPIDFVVNLLGEEFDIERVVVFEEPAANAGKPDFYDEIRQRVAHRSSICDDRLSQSLLERIFGEEEQSIRSCAFVPILHRDLIKGVIVLGSADAKRFHPELGVLYLNRIGRLIGSYLNGKQQAVE
ncbi:MAG: DUF484 family protein [Gammaproteobacteria bacterium]|nr:DUF484 family protein [Gammaproteobacteria bacterium]